MQGHLAQKEAPTPLGPPQGGRYRPPSGGEQQDAAAPVACFKAPQGIKAVRRHGATLCVGCRDGVLLFLQAPFLAA
jgi:hypothetical protein